jgi:hypothetical protein
MHLQAGIGTLTQGTPRAWLKVELFLTFGRRVKDEQ